ncbi:MAG: putative Ig domain-containing protein, partial [Candidatus Marinimicrobia bacterium]|nr:putative Ig domain-containing protein [Candidatus Neomarinimicrobiota bacterium]
MTRQLIMQWRSPGAHKQLIIGDFDVDGSADLLLPYTDNGQMYLDILSSFNGIWPTPSGEWLQATRQTEIYNNNTLLNTSSYQTYVDVVPVNNLTVDLHVTGPKIELLTKDQYHISTELSNLTPSFFTGDISVRFYDGEILPDNLLGEVLTTDLKQNETRTVTLPQSISLDQINSDIMAVDVQAVNPLVECKTANNQASSRLVHWRVTDSYGLSTELAYGIRVQEINGIPSPSGTLPNATVSEPYQEQIIFTNTPLDESVILHFVSAPAGLSLDSSGLVNWTPTQDQVGINHITLNVQDESGLSASINRLIRITVNPSGNLPPVITSSPDETATVNENYAYQILASDPEGTDLSYQLIPPIDSASISNTGLLNWTPTTAGDQDITIRVTDSDGFYTDQAFTITVNPGTNNPPTITSTPSNSGGLNRLYYYQMVIVDDTPILSYQLIQSPTGMSLDQTGLINWTPDAVGEYTIIARVEDGANFLEQTWTITVIDPINDLGGEIILSASVLQINSQLTIGIQSLGTIGNVQITAAINGTPITLDQNFQSTIEVTTLGTHLITATISDEFDSVEIQKSFEVIEENGNIPPVVDIISPEDGSTITGFSELSILVQDDNISSWRLSYRNAEDDIADRITLATGTTEINNAVVASFDTSLLQNGIYQLLLEATDINGESVNIGHSLFLEGDLKLGHFSIAFEDLNIPVAGIPITITRGYDSRDRNQTRAFGKGWSIGYQSLRLSESRIPGLGWQQQVEYFEPLGLPITMPRYCIRPLGEPLVSVRLPDGQLEKFKIRGRVDNPTSLEKPECQDFVPPQLFGIEFIAQGDTNSTLSSNTGQSGLQVINGNLELLAQFNPIDPNQYTLTTLDGTIYSIDQGFNVRQIDTTEGYSIEFRDDGIYHSAGLLVAFTRDPQDRITRIEKPDGQGIDYSYNTEGELTSFTDLNGNITTFTYIQDSYLEDIIDPRGITVARNEYDIDGKLIAHIDANGNRIQYDNDLITMTSTITDRRGNATINAFDNAGNILIQTNALGQSTTYTYDDRRQELSRTNHLGHRTEWTYNNQGNQLTETDPLGNITTSSYNLKGELLTQSDPS